MSNGTFFTLGMVETETFDAEKNPMGLRAKTLSMEQYEEARREQYGNHHVTLGEKTEFQRAKEEGRPADLGEGRKFF